MLTQAVDDYLAVRRAAGFKLQSTERYLRYFFCTLHPCRGALSRDPA
jgi:hypothetical protein